MRSFLALHLVISLTGCAGVLIEPEDSRLTKAGKVAARIPVALVTLGVSEFAYLCAKETDPPSAFAADRGEDAKSEWAHLTPQGRIDECLDALAGAESGYSGYGFQQSDWMSDWMKDTAHHNKGHEHHHGHGC